MMKQAKNSSINPEQIKPETVKPLSLDYVKAGRSQPPIDNTQLRQKTRMWRLTITWTGYKSLLIWFVPSLIEIVAIEDWHTTRSEAYVMKDDINCYYNTGWTFTEATWQTVIYLSHAGVTSAVLTQYDKITRINCTAYNHSAIVYWIAHP